jgi:MFS family permease
VLHLASACSLECSTSAKNSQLGIQINSIQHGFRLLSFRHGLWFLGNSSAVLLGGVIAWGIGHIEGELHDWQYLFIVLGAITSAWGILMLFLLPDSPSTARFLTPDERTAAVERVRENRTAVSTGEFKMSQAMEAFRDPQAWLLSINMFGSMLVNSGLSAVSFPTTFTFPN